MVEDDRYCLDIHQQISSVYEALRGTAKIVMQSYLEVCVTNAIRSNSTKREKISIMR